MYRGHGSFPLSLVLFVDRERRLRIATTLFTSGSVAALCVLGASSAHAVCMASNSSLGLSLPSISATEVSTTQAVEMVRRRQQDEQASLILASAAAASVGSAVEPSTSPPKNPSGKAAKPAGTSATNKSPQSAAASVAAADSAVSRYQTPTQSRGVWAQGYGDRERRTGLTVDVARPGEISRNEWTKGFVAGADWTRPLSPDGKTGIMLGGFGGYNSTKGKEGSGTFREDIGQPQAENFLRSSAEQTIEGGFLGGYAAFFRDSFSVQAVFKADIYDVSQSDTLQPLDANGAPCAFAPVSRAGHADLNNYIGEIGVGYRFDLSRSSWLEPIGGVRVTYSDYSNASGDIGVTGDGHVLRVQGGLRYGWVAPLRPGLVTTTLTGLLYSDVVVSGFSSIGGIFTPETPVTDEGKLRVLGQISTRLDRGDGYSYLFQVETRGGEDLFGIGGRIGARYEW